MTHLRKMMLEELQRRNYSDSTARGYLSTVAAFVKHFGKPPDQLGPDELRRYQAYLLKNRKLAVGTVIARVSALRFFFIRTLKRHEFRQDLPYPKKQRRLPTVLSLDEVSQLIDAAGNLQQRTVLMILYGTGMRRAEVARLKVADVDTRRMIIRVECGKGGNDRDLPLSPALLETRYVSIGAGRSQEPICSPVTAVTVAKTSPCRIRAFGTPAQKLPDMLAFENA